MYYATYVDVKDDNFSERTIFENGPKVLHFPKLFFGFLYRNGPKEVQNRTFSQSVRLF